MKLEFLGDSFDIVKRFWRERLDSVAPLLAHPRFVRPNIRAQFETLTRIPVVDEFPAGAFGLFLDPHTGIPLPNSPTQNVSPAYAPLAFIEAELHRLKPAYMICSPFLFAAATEGNLQLVRRQILDSGIPESRLEFPK